MTYREARGIFTHEFDHSNRCWLCRGLIGAKCPHCVAGIYAETERGVEIYCDACHATGKVQPVSEFSNLCAAVVKDGGFDTTAALACADYLEERDDARGVRLRRRVRQYEKRLDRMKLEWRLLLAMNVGLGVVNLTEWKERERDTVLSYFFRLMSAGWGDPLPRWTVGGAYWVVGPGVRHHRPAGEGEVGEQEQRRAA